jgi:hypothetical protein
MRPIASTRWKCVSFEAQLRVVLQQRGCQGAGLGEHLDAREAAADDHDGQKAVALGTGGEVRRAVEVREDAVADATASSIVFRPIAFSAMPGIGKVRETAPAVTTIWS